MPDLWERIRNVISDGLILPVPEEHPAPFPTYKPRNHSLPMQSYREEADRRHAALTIEKYKARFEREMDYRYMLTLGGTEQFTDASRFLEQAATSIRSATPHNVPLPHGVMAQDLLQPLMPMLERYGVIPPDPITEYMRMKDALRDQPLSPEEVQTLRGIAAGQTPEPSEALTSLDTRGLVTVFTQPNITPVVVQIEDAGTDRLHQLDAMINQHTVPGAPEHVPDQSHGHSM